MPQIIATRTAGHIAAPKISSFTNVKHLDSQETNFFLRQLEWIKQQVIDIKYAEMKARKLIPVNTEVSPGANSFAWRQFNQVGKAQRIRDYSADLPRVDVVGAEFYDNKLISNGVSFGYNTKEIRNAKYTGVPLDQRRALTAVEALLQLENTQALTGDSDVPLVGLLNNNIMDQVSLPADGAGASISWATKTADQILRDMNLLANHAFQATLEVEQADTFLVPSSIYTLIATKRIGIDSNMTVLKYFLETNPFIDDVEPLVQLTGVGGGQSDRILVYKRDTSKLEMIVPMQPTQYEPEKRGLEYVVDLEAMFGGLMIYKPKAIAYADGI